MIPLISVIVPIYNVELYLPKCIDSIINQTYTKLEIILVNDGSPDNCGKICDEYAVNDLRIKVIHKDNGGLSDARNVAIDVAKGEYLTFIDSDDFVSVDYVETLYNLVKKYNVKLSVSQFLPIYENESITPHHNDESQEFILSSYDAIETMFYQKLFETSAWGKLYHRSLWEDSIRYPIGVLCEDLATTYKLIFNADSVAVTTYKTYYYLIRDSSIMGNAFNNKKNDILYIGNLVKSHLEELDSRLVKPFLCRMLSSYFNVFFQIDKGNEYENVYWKKICEYRLSVLLDKKARLKTRTACLISYLGKNAVRYMFSFIDKRK